MGSRTDPRATISHVLNSNEATALDALAIDLERYWSRHALRSTVTESALAKLVELGLAKIGVVCPATGVTGWRITDNGWICMFGKTAAEIRNVPVGATIYALPVWQWPPRKLEADFEQRTSEENAPPIEHV